MDLALKYRPKTFDDVIGQDFITNILSKQIKTKTHKNAYLFCGAHGCGKTTCARIFSNEINHGEGQPIEIDGASNNGVDNIRALIEDAQQSSIDCDYKVYIIDEAHMITTAGWNAALKLIEEPPLHCVFIFCTTNPEKIPNTILSRVQRFDFGKISNNLITARLKYILDNEHDYTYEIDALNKLAILSQGHMRDAIKLLDSCIDVDDNVSLDLVESTFGLIKQESINKIIDCLMVKNFDECIKEYEHCQLKSFDGIKLFDAILSNILDKIINNASNEQLRKNMCNIFYENRKIANKDNADTILKYCFIKCCE